MQRDLHSARIDAARQSREMWRHATQHNIDSRAEPRLIERIEGKCGRVGRIGCTEIHKNTLDLSHESPLSTLRAEARIEQCIRGAEQQLAMRRH
jgi:hypothetical protein